MPAVMSQLRKIRSNLLSITGVRILKGVLAYHLIMALFFVDAFRRLFTYPIVLNGAFLVSIAGFPGKSVGEALGAGIFALSGACVGAVVFVIEAKLRWAPVAQGFILVVFLYVMAYIKSLGLKFFGFSLLGILVGFSGIYTSYLVDGFSPAYLSDYLKAYAFGAAAVIVVNVFVWPMSSEKELRFMLVTALERTSHFADLIIKTYALQITQEEKAARNALHGSIRADYAALGEKLGTTALEINWSKYQMSDYGAWTARTKDLQQSLIAMSSGISSLDQFTGETDYFRKTFLDDAMPHIQNLRKSVYLVLQRITGLMAPDHQSPLRNTENFADYIDEVDAGSIIGEFDGEKGDEERLKRRLTDISDKLRKEHMVPSRHNSRDRDNAEKASEDGSAEHPMHRKTISELLSQLQEEWTTFKAAQNDRVAQIFASGSLEDAEAPLAVEMAESRQHTEKDAKEALERHENDVLFNMTAIRVKSFLFGFEQLITDLVELANLVVAAHKKKPSVRIHFLDNFRPSSKKKEADSHSDPIMTKDEALALLGEVKKRPAVSSWVRFWMRMKRIEAFATSETSLYACKTMLATLILAVILLAPSTRSFFNQYGLTSALITVIVGMQPNLGASFFTFLLQILGTGMGSIFGMIVMEIFKNVGGYRYNPFGITCFSLLLSIPGSYIIYTNPIFFPMALLAMNAVGVLLVTEVVYENRPGFDSPPLRGARILAAMSIALAIALCFQLLILRRPARRVLRKSLGAVYYELLTYQIIFNKVVDAVVKPPVDDQSRHVSQEAMARIVSDLKKREAKLQASIIALMPLVKFSQVEPSLVRKFNAPVVAALIKHAQVILDRFKEARYSVGVAGFGDEIRKDFTEKLYPYRKNAVRYNIVQFYLVANSLATKRPLPRELPGDIIALNAESLHRDSLIISARLAKTEEGKALLASDEFSRYFFYLASVMNVTFNLRKAGEVVKDLFGELEDELLYP